MTPFTGEMPPTDETAVGAVAVTTKMKKRVRSLEIIIERLLNSLNRCL